MTPRPQLWVIAGPNGSGKSTLTARHRLQERMPVVNPDEIAKGLSDHSPVKAGKMAILKQERLLAQGKTFALETTLSGKRELEFMRRAREAGYKVNLVFIATAGPKINIGRVIERLSNGGHDVPDEDVERRYQRALEKLPEAINRADRSFVLDNSRVSQGMRLLFSREGRRVKYISRTMPIWAKTNLEKYVKEYNMDMGL